MGGWRKLWFVLQNRLLLSYSSKEDCEKKLAPFKDVVSLVPGTIIKPGKGFRFIVETTTNIIYTYRCDDSKSCSEWMAALVECLSSGNQNVGQQMQSNQVKYHFSLDNLPISEPKRPMKLSRSWNSIVCRSKSMKSSPNLPIVSVTARILENKGLPANSVDVKTRNGWLNENVKEKVQNFRLHQNYDLANIDQSHEVCRINSMFQRYEQNDSTGAEHHSDNNNLLNNNSKIKSDRAVNDREIMVEPKHESKRIVEMCENCHFEDKIRRLTLLDDTLDSQRTKSRSETTLSPASELLNENDFKESLDRQLSSTSSNVSEPIYAVVDLKTKYARRAKIKDMQEKLERERPKSFNVLSSDYEELLHYQNYMERNEDENENIYEPIAIPELVTKHPMWRYFPKINIEALIEITKKNKNNQEPSTFYDIRKRWGNHRKSIKNRMKKFYSRESSPALTTAASANSICADDDLGSQAATCSMTSASSSAQSSASTSSSSTSSRPSTEKHRDGVVGKDRRPVDSAEKQWKSDKSMFGSLGRLRKPRTSLCIAELSPRNRPFHADDVEFQRELKKELIKRNDSNKMI